MKNLTTEFPIIQAPMNWLTDATLVAAVSNAGGLGVLGTNAGQTEIASDPADVKQHMIDQIHRTQELTDNDFSINILTPENDQKLADSSFTMAFLDAAFENHVKYFVVVGIVHREIFTLIKRHNGIIIFRPLTPSVEKAKLAESIGADFIVATGHDEGGILPANEQGTLTIVPEIVDSVSIPVFAAGGINDARTVKAAMALGAVGVFVGTRFLASEEAPVAPEVKQLLVDSNSNDTVMVSSNQRAIATNRAITFAHLFQETHDTTAVNKAVARDGGIREAMLLGRIDRGIITVNNSLSTIKEILSVKKIIINLFE